MTVTVSGMTVTGKTRALPKVNSAFDKAWYQCAYQGADNWCQLCASSYGAGCNT